MDIMLDWILFGLCIVFAAGVLYSRISAKDVQVAVRFPSVIFKQEKLKGTVEVSFRKKFFFGKVKIHLKWLNRMNGEELTKTCNIFVGAGEMASCMLELEMPYSGKVVCTVEKVQVTDWFGMTRKTVHPKGKAGILVMPEYSSCDVDAMVHLQDNLDGMLLVPDKRGYDYSEMIGVREYQQGDSMKSIHWKLTGRMDKLFVKEASVPVEEQVVVFAETIRSTALSAEACDKLASRLFGICTGLLERKIPYQVCWYDKEKEQLIEAPVESHQDLQRVLHKVLGCRQIQGEQPGRMYYEQLRGPKEMLYIS